MIRKLAIALFAFIALPAAAHAAMSTESIGPHFGFSLSPDQLLLGGQLTFAEIAPQVSFVPGAEIGIGDHQTNIDLNMDFHYRFKLRDTDWVPYLGFGLGLDFQSIDQAPPYRDNSDTFVGGNFILGATVPTRSNSKFFSELKLGLGDLPSLKAIVGWNYRR